MKERELPEGWEWRRLGNVASVGAGNGAPQGEKYFKNGNYPFVRTSDVGMFKKTSNLNITRDRVNDLAIKENKLRLFAEKTLLIPKSGASTFLNHRALLGMPAYVSSHLATIVAHDDSVLPEYLYYWSLSLDVRDITHDINYPSLKLPEIESVKIPIPPLPTQRKIVAILERAEHLRCLRAEADALTQQLVQSVFLEMFGDPVTNPMGWDVVKLRSLGNWTSGGTPSRSVPEYFRGDIPWYTTGELNDSFLQDSIEHISEDGLNSSPAIKLFPTGTMLIGMYDSAAFKMGILSKPSASNQACAAYFPNNKLIETLFALYLFKIMRPVFLKNRRGIRQKNLTQGMIKEFEVPLPPLNKQHEFAEMATKAYGLKRNQKMSDTELNLLSNSLMSKAFTGELIA